MQPYAIACNGYTVHLTDHDKLKPLRAFAPVGGWKVRHELCLVSAIRCNTLIS